MTSYNFILLCLILSSAFSLYIYLVISSLVFSFMYGVTSRLLFYCDFMNS